MKTFFRKLLEHSIYTAITVALALIGILGYAFVDDHWDKVNNYYERGAHTEIHYSVHEDIAPNFVISDKHIVSGGEHFMATGKIKNVSDKTWVSVALRSKQYVDGVQVGECLNANIGRDFENYLPGKSYPFVFECDSVSGKNLPDGFSFEILFSRGTAVYVHKS